LKDEAEREVVLTGIKLGLDPVFSGCLSGIENTENVGLVWKTIVRYISPTFVMDRPEK